MRVDARAARQVFHNLLGNACKFTHAGSITVSALLKHDEVEVAVSDTGIGMPEDKQQGIFEPFEQVGVVRVGHASLFLCRGHGRREGKREEEEERKGGDFASLQAAAAPAARERLVVRHPQAVTCAAVAGVVPRARGRWTPRPRASTAARAWD